MRTQGQFYELIDCDSAPAFVDAISPTSQVFQTGDWIFRGQCRDLALVPSAYRVERMAPVKHRPFKYWNYWVQTRAELKLIRRFYKHADRAGLSIPEDSHELRSSLATIDRDHDAFVRDWPPGHLLALIALAQHHGVATRLLDWSYSPWVAAYFAAAGVFACKAADALKCKIVLWAFDASIGVAVPADEQGGEDEAIVRTAAVVEVVTSPYGSNRNLAAQRGVHLLYRLTEPPKPMAKVRRDPLDHALQHAHVSAMEDYEKALYKFVLPPTEAGSLLRLLARHGFTGATLFPGFDGVVRAMSEEDRWKRR